MISLTDVDSPAVFTIQYPGISPARAVPGNDATRTERLLLATRVIDSGINPSEPLGLAGSRKRTKCRETARQCSQKAHNTEDAGIFRSQLVDFTWRPNEVKNWIQSKVCSSRNFTTSSIWLSRGPPTEITFGRICVFAGGDGASGPTSIVERFDIVSPVSSRWA
ncbi:MAG: hypothetical protein A07HR60_01386 [uncultured archaeon A07HR60]|nr:MAG: hypothetical protein A07HR60_01386 [uncultured archaeon A07HR60]